MGKQYLTINGVTFEVVIPKCKLNADSMVYGKPLSACYIKPSATKESIFADWFKWYMDTEKADLATFGVRSYNCNFFTLCAIVFHESHKYIMDVTYAHNRLIQVY